MADTWEDHQKWELEWHLHNNNCANSYNEETKQYIYAHLMGLDKYATNYYGVKGWDFGDRVVLDVGGGPYSMLLKAKAKEMDVVDPLNIPFWCIARYEACGITYIRQKAENLAAFKTETPQPYADIVLCYNVLQHTEKPEKIVQGMRKVGKTIHFFDWIDTPKSPGHPQTLTEEMLNKWFGGEGKVEQINQNGAVGKCYYGIFKGCYYK